MGLCPIVCGVYARVARLDVADDVGEDVADGWSEQGQNDDHDNRDQNKNQRVLDQTLASLLRSVQHGFHLLSIVPLSPCFEPTIGLTIMNYISGREIEEDLYEVFFLIQTR